MKKKQKEIEAKELKERIARRLKLEKEAGKQYKKLISNKLKPKSKIESEIEAKAEHIKEKNDVKGANRQYMNYLAKHLLDIDHLSKDYIYDLLIGAKNIKNNKNNSDFNFKGKDVCALFYEDSTRTKLSFQKAASNLNLNFHNLDVQKLNLHLEK